MTPDLIYDQMIGMGCADKLVFSWVGNPGVGSLHRFRDAYENGWPRPIAIEEHSHAAMANAYEAGAAGLPCAIFRGYIGVDLPKVNPNIKRITCPFTGEQLAAIPAIRPDVAVMHALKADRAGNVLIEGIVGVQKEAVLASKRSLVTVEEIVDDLGPRSPNAVILPRWTVGAIAVRAGRRASLLRARLLQARQRVLSGMGQDRPRPRQFPRLDESECARTGSGGVRGACKTPERRGGVRSELRNHHSLVIPARREAENPESHSRGPHDMDSGLAPLARAGMTSWETAFESHRQRDDDRRRRAGAAQHRYLLCRHRHAVGCVQSRAGSPTRRTSRLIYESGTIGTKPDVLPLSIGDGELCDTALTTVSVPEMFRYWLQGGRITVGFLGGAQIDRFANLNTTVVGPYDKPKVRLPGGGGAPEIAVACGEIFIIMRQAPRSFVDKLDFFTSFGHGAGRRQRARLGVKTKGPTKLMTDFAVYEPDAETREMTVLRCIRA